VAVWPRIALGLVLLATLGCRDRAPTIAPGPEREPAAIGPDGDETAEHEQELATLLAFEEQTRGATDFASRPPAEDVLGPDPYRIAQHPDGTLIGLVRGAAAVVVLAADGSERARAPAPRSASGLAISSDGDVLVVGDGDRWLGHYRLVGDRLERVATLPVGVLGMRDIAVAPDARTAYIVEEREGRLLELALARDRGRALRITGQREVGRCHGPLQIEVIAGYVVTNCLLDHALEIRRGRDLVRIRHDGPLWGFAIQREPDGGALIVAGGVEDHPLEREDGGFGYIDSFLYVYRLAPGATTAVRVAEINASALGAITPKWVALRGGSDVVITTAGYGGARLLELAWPGRDFTAAPRITETAFVPGIADAVVTSDGGVVAANPLLDAWIVHARGETRVIRSPGSAPRSQLSRMGELLFFTHAMAPWSSSDGKLSRFTCETCHHEGYVDGRTHYTGRDDVHATSRPLYGLFNNRPHFSRALDETTTEMVHSEFRVANRWSGRDPWFELTRDELPWLAHADVPARMSPETLRRAFMSFLLDFSHRANPAALDRDRFTELERAGALAFRDRCASCHAPRLVADDAASVVPFERWESLVLSRSGPIVWSDAAYARTGVTPYVHAKGARSPSLRRLYKKWPYFTNGSAKSLAEVVDRFAWDDHQGFHDQAPAAARRLSAADRRALLAFLDLL
jgi:hypothetical protein